MWKGFTGYRRKGREKIINTKMVLKKTPIFPQKIYHKFIKIYIIKLIPNGCATPVWSSLFSPALAAKVVMVGGDELVEVEPAVRGMP
jgi:hypothetical protein